MDTKEWKLRVQDLQDKSFTDDFKQNKLAMDVWFDSFENKHFLSEGDMSYDGFLDYYDSGELLSFIVPIESNKDKIKEVIKDIKFYQELTNMLYSTSASERQIDLISVADYMETKLGDHILYDDDREEFYYDSEENN